MSQQQPRDNHFVPKGYLKRFAFDDKKNVYKTPIKSIFKNISVKSANASSICYIPDFYTIRTRDLLQKYNLNNPYYIETNAFDYEDRFLEKQLDVICMEKEISYLNARKVLEAILDIKRRNQFFKGYFENEQLINSLLEKQILSLEKAGKKNESELKKRGIEYEQVIRDVEIMAKKQFGNKDFLNDLYLESFIDRESTDSNLIKGLSKSLSKLTFYIFKTIPCYPFITNDNPGSTLLENDVIRNTSFSNWSAFSFPLDPLRLLMIIKDDKDKSKGVFKKLETRKADIKFVDLANKASVINCNKLIISNQRSTLEKLNNQYHQYYI